MTWLGNRGALPPSAFGLTPQSISGKRKRGALRIPASFRTTGRKPA